jgi:hypothetical protein
LKRFFVTWGTNCRESWENIVVNVYICSKEGIWCRRGKVKAVKRCEFLLGLFVFIFGIVFLICFLFLSDKK